MSIASPACGNCKHWNGRRLRLTGRQRWGWCKSPNWQGTSMFPYLRDIGCPNATGLLHRSHGADCKEYRSVK